MAINLSKVVKWLRADRSEISAMQIFKIDHSGHQKLAVCGDWSYFCCPPLLIDVQEHILINSFKIYRPNDRGAWPVQENWLNVASMQTQHIDQMLIHFWPPACDIGTTLNQHHTNLIHWSNAGLMSGQHRRPWCNIWSSSMVWSD